MKECCRCKIKKDKKEFGNRKYHCKECAKIETKEYFRSKDGLITRIYSHQKQRWVGAKPTYTKQELKDWLFSQEKFHLLYDNWKRLDFQKNYVPSVDRIDDNIGYTIANIQLLTWEENNKKGYKSRASGENTKASKGVKQYSKDGVLIKKFYSMNEASRKTGVRQGNIAQCCNNERNTAGGFVWILDI